MVVNNLLLKQGNIFRAHGACDRPARSQKRSWECWIDRQNSPIKN